MSISKPKIAIISITLSSGGAERFAGLLGLMLEEKGFEIHQVIINNAADFHFNGKLLNLGKLCENEVSIVRKIKKGILLSRYLKENEIDIIIDNRTRNNFIRDFLAKLIFGNRKKYAVIQNYNLKNYLPKVPFLAKILYKDTEKLICVSNAIEQKVIKEYGFTNTQTIYNPVLISDRKSVDIEGLPEKFILFFGRLEEKHKNLSLLLDGFLESRIFDSGYKLLILGNGPDKDFIKNKINVMKMNEMMQMIPFTENPFGYVSKARFTVLTSNYEGFPLSIIESLSLETPVVAVDCNSGPREVIKNGYNGLLVKNHDIDALSNAFQTMIFDENLYQNCKNNTKKSIEHLSLENLAKQWEKLIKLENDNH